MRTQYSNHQCNIVLFETQVSHTCWSLRFALSQLSPAVSGCSLPVVQCVFLAPWRPAWHRSSVLVKFSPGLRWWIQLAPWRRRRPSSPGCGRGLPKVAPTSLDGQFREYMRRLLGHRRDENRFFLWWAVCTGSPSTLALMLSNRIPRSAFSVVSMWLSRSPSSLTHSPSVSSTGTAPTHHVNLRLTYMHGRAPLRLPVAHATCMFEKAQVYPLCNTRNSAHHTGRTHVAGNEKCKFAHSVAKLILKVNSCENPWGFFSP